MKITFITKMKMNNMVKWKEEYNKWLETANNGEIFDEYTECVVGDDWDGGRTKRCEWKLIQVEKELHERFLICGFLNA